MDIPSHRGALYLQGRLDYVEGFSPHLSGKYLNLRSWGLDGVLGHRVFLRDEVGELLRLEADRDQLSKVCNQ
jgi:hypothetical protein